MLFLVGTNRHQISLIHQNIGGHQHGIGKQTGVDVIGILGGLVLELGHTGQLAEHGVAVQDPGQLGMGRNVGLDKEHTLFRVNTSSQQAGQGAVSIFTQLRRLLTNGDRMLIGHHVDAVELVLHVGPVTDGADIVSQGKLIARGLDTAEDDLLLFHGKFCHIFSTPFVGKFYVKYLVTYRFSIPFFLYLSNRSSPSFAYIF